MSHAYILMKYFYFSAFPFGRLLIPLLGGRIISLFLPFSSLLFWALISIVLLGVVLLGVPLVIRYSKRWWWGAIICCLLFFVGLINTPNYSFNSKLFEEEYIFRSTVSDVAKNNSMQQSLLLTCKNSSLDTQFYFSALAYLKKDSLFHDFKPGDQLMFKAKLQELKLTRNPYAFEYARYLQKRGVSGQFFLKSNEFVRVGEVYTYQRFFYQLKVWAERKLRNLNLGNEEFGIVSALVLGDKSFLEYDTKLNFSSSGAIHVLSVSGLHVGVLYLLLVSLFGNNSNVRFVSFVKMTLILMVLWFYASITGMTPSVFRSTIMFTVFLIARWKNEYYNIYHSVAIAAFIILIINPYSVIQAGFWLSFFAVISIVYFYPRIFSLFYFRTPWAKYIWSLISVSFAAQIGTFPLAIYLFGFFPTWFLVSNLLIIPILPIVLLGSLIVIILPFDSLPVELIKTLLQSTIIYMNDSTKWISYFPFAKFTKLQFVFYEIVLAYLSIIFMVLWQQLKSAKYLILALSFCSLMLLANSYKSHLKCNEAVFTVHQVKGKTAITYMTKNKSICLVQTALSTKDISQSIQPLWLTQEINSIQQVSLSEYSIFPVSNALGAILIVNGNVFDIKEINDLEEIDTFVFTSSTSLQKIKMITKYIKDKCLVFDSSFSTFKAKRMKEQLNNLQLNMHFVSLEGAYSIQL